MGYARWRLIGAAAIVALGVTLGSAGPASADVSIAPDEFAQGQAGQLKFRVTNENPTAALTRIELRLPEEYPIAEVVPMSVEGWAPEQTMRPNDRPLTTEHGTGQVTEVVATVTYSPLPGAELPPGGAIEFRLSMFNLPEAEVFVVPTVLTFADGSVVNQTARPGATATAGERPAPSITLAAPPAVAEEDEGTGATDDGGTEPGDSRESNLLWMFALLVLIGGITAFALMRQRRESPSTGRTSKDEGDDDNDSAAASMPERAIR